MKRFNRNLSRDLVRCLALALLCHWCQTLPAQAAPADKSAATPMKRSAAEFVKESGGAILDRDHLLGAGDTIEINVSGYPQFSKTVKLFADGSFDYPILGSVDANGLTIKELQERITEGFRKELRRPVVYVNLLSIFVPPPAPAPVVKTPTIVALGAVSRKGTIELPQPRPLRQIIEELGPNDRADLTTIRIRKPDGTARIIDVSDFRIKGSFKDDIMITGGEEIIVVERPEVQRPEAVKIQVLGHVMKTGFLSFEGNPPLLEVLDKAGGVRQGAAMDRIKVMNGTSEQIVNIEKYAAGDVSANYFCKTGDVILVSEKPLKVLVFGEVTRPGDIAIDEDKTLARVLLEAGLAAGADRTKVELIREVPGGKVERKTINVVDIERQKKDDVKLLRGDVLYVPPKVRKKGIVDYLSAIASPLWLIRSIAPVGF